MAKPSIADKVQEACVSLAVQVRERSYDCIVTSGRSSEMAVGLLEWGWKRRFPDVALPPTHVISPEGNDLLYKGCSFHIP